MEAGSSAPSIGRCSLVLTSPRALCTAFVTQVGESLRMHYPTLARRGCEVLVAYSRFHKTPVEPGTVRFADQGIKVASVPLCGL